MNKFKSLSIAILSCLFLCIAMPHLSAKHHSHKHHSHKHHHKHKSTSLALNFNVNPTPSYSYYTPTYYAYQPVQTYYVPTYQRVYYPVYSQTVVSSPVYVQPSLSFSSWFGF